MATVTGPLTNAEYSKFNTALGQLSITREFLLKAKRAGVPVDEPLAVLDAFEHQITVLKQEFFPDRQ